MRLPHCVGLLITASLLVAACGDDDSQSTSDDDLVTVISSTTQSTSTTSTIVASSTAPLGSLSPTTATGGATSVPASSTTGPEESTTTTADVPGQSNLSVDDDVSTVGLGPVFVGMTVAEAAQAAGTPFTAEAGGENRCTFYRAADFAEGVAWLVAFDRIAAVHIESGPITTRSGLGIGSSAQQVRDAFGAQVQERPSPFDPAVTELVFVPADENEANQRVIFEVDGTGSVVRYHSGQLPEVEYGRDCRQR
jgi:hypothetical protein